MGVGKGKNTMTLDSCQLPAGPTNFYFAFFYKYAVFHSFTSLLYFAYLKCTYMSDFGNGRF